MLHRLALRVIPQLNAAVTESAVRKRKRWVMLLPGLIAFLLYRLLKDILPLGDPFVLLAFGGAIATVTALWAYRMGRQQPVAQILNSDSLQFLVWVAGWIGCVYGMQLSLLVLAMLALFVDYNFLLHPEGPAMMALIIPTTAVTRDAFEIGHVMRLESQGTRMVTFPNGRPLRELWQRDPLHVGQWSASGFFVGGLAALGLGLFGDWGLNGIGQALMSMLVAGSVAYLAFFHGQFPTENWSTRFGTQSWWERVQFWTWPCLTFALTYYLVLWGFLVFLLNFKVNQIGLFAVLTGLTTALMVGYGYFLGTRVFVEKQTQGEISEGLRRCPFVMEILAKTGWVSPTQVPAPSSLSTRPAEPSS
ncbi:hypothetical protein [Candidatus Nitronereus thalassa]|uniref:Uncharacterized protein n=1 Tax=Candidatus Nitronereus thalassa TaxID=3020898 RepID=A0ABU3KD51_9BACT|nr:hypothetical protein [Candidatus Nitronereus thalassa]MDT7044177.1 hypothetical protein [Candidatus Nitronereus thalassa]